MAQNAERQDFTQDPRSSIAGSLSTPAVESASVASSRAPILQLPRRQEIEPDDFNSVFGNVLEDAQNAIFDIYRTTQNKIVGTYNNVAEACSEVSQRARSDFRQMKEEQPLKLLAIAGATAFAVGFMLRIWRSSRYEQ